MEQQQQILNSINNNNNSSSKISSSTRSPKRPPLPAALRTITSPQRPLQRPAFTNLQHLNLQAATPPRYTPLDIVNSSNNSATTDNANDILSWICSVCTFQNHPLLNKCEQCEQPRNPLGTIQITAAHFEPRFENVQYQQQAHTNNNKIANARSFSLTNTVLLNESNNSNSNQIVPQTAPPSDRTPFFTPNNGRVVSSLEELQYENVVQERKFEEHTYVNVGSMSLGNIPGVFKTTDSRPQPSSSTFVKGHRYRPSM